MVRLLANLNPERRCRGEKQNCSSDPPLSLPFSPARSSGLRGIGERFATPRPGT